ncbi:Hypothetical predicted protein [Mytilus galloprovincialis]|uniref:SSD domain-containing protein n=1 Tax=Mytilus galloprovincialis TaxID=29158 RepID=A0A8B6HGC5_MYTGA|nr:Hypothetical predicted protein [Mytilus galloprovincialis]
MTKNDILRIKESEDGKKNELDNQNDNSGILQNNCEEKTEKETRKIKTKNLKRCSSTVQPLPLGENNESFTAENRKKEESKTPLKYCVFITNHPFLTFGVTSVDTTWYNNGEIGDTLEIIVEGNDVFSATNLELLSQTENRLFNFQDFQSDYCVINGQGTCEKPISVLRLFDGTYKDADPVFDSPSFVNASSVICKATQTNETKEFIQLVLQKDYDPCDLGKTSSKTRFFMFFGWPLVGYNDDQKLSDYQVQKLRPEIENIRDNLLEGQMDLYYMSIKLFEYDVKKQAFADMKLAIGSFAFIFVFMLFQTGSFWITSFGILSIITSFLLTNLIYRFAFKYEYFGFFHIISIFIILGIGADDVFIFYDTWRLSGNTEYPSKAHRLSDCYRKAAKTTFVTSLTTMAAFLVSAPSPLLPVSSFGLFSGMLVGVNYLFDLICFPVVILVYSEAIKPMFDKCVSYFPCCRSEELKSERTISQESLIITHRRSRLYSKNIGMYNPDLPKFNKMFKRKMEINEEEESTSQTDETKEKKHFEDRNKVVLFLKNGFYDFMTRRSVKIIVPLVFFGTSIFFIYNATTLEPDSNQVEIYRNLKNHYINIIRSRSDEKLTFRGSYEFNGETNVYGVCCSGRVQETLVNIDYIECAGWKLGLSDFRVKLIEHHRIRHTKRSSRIHTYNPVKMIIASNSLPCAADNKKKNIHTEIGKNNKVNHSATPRFLLKYCQFIEKHLCIAFAATLGLHTSIVLTTILLIVKSYNVFPISFQDLPLVLYNDTSHKQDLAWRYAMHYKNKVIHPIFGVKPRKQLSETLELIFEGDDIFSEINMKLLNETESELFYRQDFQAEFCYPSVQNDCEKSISVLRLFDGTYTDADPVFNSGSFKNASSIICRAVKNNKTRVFLLPLLEKGYDPCTVNQISSRTRIFMLFSWKSKEHYNENKYREYLVLKIQKEIIRIRDEVLDGHMSVYYYSIKMYLYDVYNEAFRNMKLAIGSFLFIYIFMWFQTKSFWITFFGILSIFTSFLLTNLIYRFVLQYRYFGFFHIISVFIILGIGADDIFIFYDTWILSKHTRYPSKAHRLADCYLKAAKTTFVTSLTTMAAFLVSAPSPLMPVASFGIFTGMLVGVNFLFDLTCFPIVILFHSEVITPCFAKLVPYSRKTLSVRTESQERLIAAHQNRTSCDNNDGSQDMTYHQLQLQDKVNEENETVLDSVHHIENKNKVVWFLENKFYNFMIWKPVRIVIPLIFLVITAFFTYSATTLEADSSQVKVYKESNNYAKAIERHFSRFQQNYDDSYNRLHLTWGMKPQNMESCDWKSGDSCIGHSEIDEHFDMSSSEAQISLMNLCRRLENFTDEEIISYGIKRNPVTNKPEIACFMPALHKFIQNTGAPVVFYWDEVSKMPSSMKSGFQSTQESWHWIKIQETLVTSAVRGVVIGISIAFPILTITTLNVVIGFLATICITMITVVVVGLIPLIGWKLGVLESINLSLIVGLSVDYVVHFAEAYRTSPFTHRKGRVKSMLEAMGLSVLSGAITTFGAAVFMLFAQIQFSYQFGIFVMCTIGTSFLFSFLLFPAFMASWGPEGNTGSIPAIVKALKLKCQRKQEYVRVHCDETYDSDIELLS